MTRAPKLLAKALAKNKNLRFDELTVLAEAFGFELARVVGSHRIYTHPDVPQPLNLTTYPRASEPVSGSAVPEIRRAI